MKIISALIQSSNSKLGWFNSKAIQLHFFDWNSHSTVIMPSKIFDCIAIFSVSMYPFLIVIKIITLNGFITLDEILIISSRPVDPFHHSGGFFPNIRGIYLTFVLLLSSIASTAWFVMLHVSSFETICFDKSCVWMFDEFSFLCVMGTPVVIGKDREHFDGRRHQLVDCLSG